MSNAILFDSSRCSSCKGCQVSCKTWNNLPSPLEVNAAEFSGSLQNPVDVNGDTRLIITFSERNEAEGGSKGVEWAFGRKACMHCADPACVKACPSGCLQIDEETGFVRYDTEKCIGCQYCKSACPFDIPRHTNVTPLGNDIVINKCDGCLDRVSQGRAPACVTTCQANSLQYGDRDEMLKIAEERVQWLHDEGYDQASVYGQDECGGLHVIYVLKYDISMYGLPENPQSGGMVDLLNIMRPLAGLAAGATVVGLGVSFLTGLGYKRDEVRYDEETHNIIDVKTGDVVKHIDVEGGER
ncbi:MAG: 4Fe-4S dicluster domain-containing protein [Raoultibacter sp.]|jgi:formate dehydrogenase iron-sulfur subunit